MNENTKNSYSDDCQQQKGENNLLFGQNIQYIIIDGGSTDGSVDIIKKYEDRLDYWVSEKDKGMYDGLRKGFAKVNGDVCAYINSDDF